MEMVPGVRLTDVDLPRDPAPRLANHTIQPETHPNLARVFDTPDYPLRVAEIPDGIQIGQGGVMAPDGRLVVESLWDTEQLARDFGRIPNVGPRKRVHGRCASLITLWYDNFFHWMFNALPRLAVLEASAVEYDWLIVPADLKPFMRETLDILGVPESKLVPYTGEHVQADTLIWAAPVSPINHPTVFLMDWVRAKFGAPDVVPTRKLYVSRRGGTRNAANEAELFAALEPLGFELVAPGELPFREQVRTFAETRLAVGPHGSNLVNGIFSSQLTAFEFFQPSHVNHGVPSVLAACGHEYWSLIVPAVRTMRGRRRFEEMSVPVDLVLETLAAIESAQLREPRASSAT